MIEDLIEELKAQRRRRRAFEEGVYELSDDEGFFCRECDWRGLTAPMSDYSSKEIAYEGKAVCKCPECGGDAFTKGNARSHLDKWK